MTATKRKISLNNPNVCPNSKRYEGAQPVWLYLNDEAEPIGSGLRLVWVNARGHKWVYLAAREARVRMAKAKYNLIVAETETRMKR